MNEKSAPQIAEPSNPSTSCDTCGRFDAREVGDRFLCPDCYEKAGSCCPGIDNKEC